jgi:hypothetical protein
MTRTIVVAGATCLTALALLAVKTQAYTTYARWTSPSVTFYANPSNADVTATAAENAFKAGLNAWTTQSGSNFRYVYGGRVSDSTTGYDSRNVLVFRNASNGPALATTYSWYADGLLVDADIVVWDAAYRFYTGTSGCSGGAYLEDVLTHELGHALGLQHSSSTSATMYPTYSYCSTAMRSLASDDVAGARALYGTASTSTSNTTTKLTLTARASQQDTGWKVSLAWTGFTSHSIDVFKNGVWYTKTLNDGATQYTFTKQGTYRWRVCAAGTSTCSAEVSVTF